MVLSEFNSDGDVTGPYDQASMLKEFCEMLKKTTRNGFQASQCISSGTEAVSDLR